MAVLGVHGIRAVMCLQNARLAEEKSQIPATNGTIPATLTQMPVQIGNGMKKLTTTPPSSPRRKTRATEVNPPAAPDWCR